VSSVLSVVHFCFLQQSHYWLTEQNELQIGWDNVPHHRHIATYPHHNVFVNQKARQVIMEKRVNWME
jgi:hypothetical protein